MSEAITIIVDGEVLEVRACPHPSGKSVSISLNAAHGCLWRTLVDVEAEEDRGDGPENDRAVLFAALGDELRRMKLVYAGPALAIGIIVGIIIGRII